MNNDSEIRNWSSKIACQQSPVNVHLDISQASQRYINKMRSQLLSYLPPFLVFLYIQSAIQA